MSSIAQPSAIVNASPAEFERLVLAEEQRMIAADGWNIVAGRFIPKALNADYFRRIEAERRVEHAQRIASWIERHPCAWCGHRIVAGESYEVVGTDAVHAETCYGDLGTFLGSEPLPRTETRPVVAQAA